MRPKIQHNESLRSYVERCIFLSPPGGSEKTISDASQFKMTNKNVRAIAEYLGWSGCYGFNRLIHNHTIYPLKGLFNPDAADMSYSGDKFHLYKNFIENKERSPAFCLRCVKDDISELGFSYWRRLPDFIMVCAKHELKLLYDCPFCGVALSDHGAGRGFRSMWEGCQGRKFWELDATYSYVEGGLKPAIIFDDMCSFEFCVPKEFAYPVLLERLTRENLTAQKKGIYLNSHINDLHKSAARLAMDKQYKYDGEGISYFIFECIVLGFDSFADFVSEVCRLGHELPRVNDTMSTCREKSSVPIRYRVDGASRRGGVQPHTSKYV
ncbi:hypothetical protein [Pseudomonas sp. ICMP 561]|uniref:hypothetical protein n=1 Tax=Pseudomonas sp. ICMP 561 TaxID=1718918 RepID=UPI0011455FC7|nr:hypothetical protein [Pseudomonas sp. ICMP 561]